MRYNKHFLRSDTPHAILSASNYAWLNYTEDKLVERVMTDKATAIGTKRHAMAAAMIEEGIRAEDIPQTFNMYVNDCIGFRMRPELVLFANEYAFGTADALSFREESNYLRIFDYKSGVNAASFKQLIVYAAFFCIEYKKNPFDLTIELRIYQNNDVRTEMADPDDVAHAIAQTHWAKKIIEREYKEAQ